MHIIHLSVECFPLAKVGGLADVVGALPRYQRKLKQNAWVVSPWYDRPFTQTRKFKTVFEGSFLQGAEELQYQVLKENKDSLGFPLYLIKIPGKLDRTEVYCYPDEAEQWIAFQHAFLDWMKNTEIMPDLVNCHDHHVGLVPFLMKYSLDFNAFAEVKTVITVHNGQYQGWMPWNKSNLLPAFDTWKWGLLDWDGLINPLASAIKCADAFTTVSGGYLLELYEQANGLEGLFKAEADKGYGIVNGIDDAYWNPTQDTLIPYNYETATVKKGKEKNKKIFCEKTGLDASLPLLTYVGRFAGEKGADLLPEIIENIFSNSENKISIFILGSGDEQIQVNLQQLLEKYAGNLAVFFGYNEGLAHEVYAAADMILMPSRVEPCGLNQLYAMKYGTIPIVRGIGGLKDTVVDVMQKNGYGFVFSDATATSAVSGVERALDYIGQRGKMQRIRKKEMELDFSWDKSAQQYINLYNRL